MAVRRTCRVIFITARRAVVGVAVVGVPKSEYLSVDWKRLSSRRIVHYLPPVAVRLYEILEPDDVGVVGVIRPRMNIRAETAVVPRCAESAAAAVGGVGGEDTLVGGGVGVLAGEDGGRVEVVVGGIRLTLCKISVP